MNTELSDYQMDQANKMEADLYIHDNFVQPGDLHPSDPILDRQ